MIVRTSKSKNLAASAARTALLLCCTLVAHSALAAEFQFLLTEGNTSIDFIPGTDVTFEQRWTEPTIWSLVSGVDFDANGIPDGDDTIVIDRTSDATNRTRLSNEIMPDHSVAKITGTGTGFGFNNGGNRDLILKQGANVTIGDLEILPGNGAFTIFEERDQPLTINGVISGAGSLELTRNSGFSNGSQRPDPVTGEDEIILITGPSPNTLTGEFFLYNSNGNATTPQPAYFVADKVGAFGQALTLTLESKNASAIFPTELQLTANTMGGEGAIDDDLTEVRLGKDAYLNLDAGVNEVIGSGKLLLDALGVGFFDTVPDGVYDNNEYWIIGDGTVTVGAAGPMFTLGDTNNDGTVDTLDIDPFVLLLTDPAGYATAFPGVDALAVGDINMDDVVDTLDIDPFVALLTAGSLTGGGAVPEPSTIVLLGLAGVASLAVRRKR